MGPFVAHPRARFWREREERIGFALMGREACALFLANLLRSIAMWEPDRSRFGGLGSRSWVSVLDSSAMGESVLWVLEFWGQMKF